MAWDLIESLNIRMDSIKISEISTKSLKLCISLEKSHFYQTVRLWLDFLAYGGELRKKKYEFFSQYIKLSKTRDFFENSKWFGSYGRIFKANLPQMTKNPDL